MSSEARDRARGKRSFASRTAMTILLVAVVWLVYSGDWSSNTDPSPDRDTAESAVVDVSPSAAAAAFQARQSGVVMTLDGTVVRLLPDDEDGSRHQRFVIRLADDHTVLVSHNIDLAPRAPVSLDTVIRLRGQYEWNDQGGVIHWTHHDPDGRRPGGWIEVDGQRFR